MSVDQDLGEGRVAGLQDNHRPTGVGGNTPTGGNGETLAELRWIAIAIKRVHNQPGDTTQSNDGSDMT